MNHPQPNDRRGAMAVAALLIGMISGCTEPEVERPKTYVVQGTVTYKGEPVPKGTITFQPDQGQPSVADIQPDGTYHLSTFKEGDGAVAGHYKVYIIANTADPTKIPGSTPGWTPPKDLVPKKYSNADTSGLQATVTEDQKEYNFDLK